MRELENAPNPRHRAVVSRALADLDAQLAALEAPVETSSVILKLYRTFLGIRPRPVEEPAGILTATTFPAEDIARILAIASAAFDDDERAFRWLQEPNIQTGEKPPVSLIGTPEGFAVVESVLHQIQYGVFG